MAIFAQDGVKALGRAGCDGFFLGKILEFRSRHFVVGGS